MSTKTGEYQFVPSNTSPESELFARGREILGKAGGGLVAKLKRHKGSVALARAILEIASTKHDPRAYIGRVLSGQVSNSDGIPDVVRCGQRDGLYVEQLAANRWKVGTWVYDEHGREIGF